jgi:hypothetical protein
LNDSPAADLIRLKPLKKPHRPQALFTSNQHCEAKEVTVSFTEVQTVFGGVHENGINDFLRAFLTARPRYINYASTGFVPTTTVNITSVPAIAFPGVPGGIQFAVFFSIPTVDLNPATGAGSAPLPPGPGQFTLKTTAILALNCLRGRPDGGQPGTVDIPRGSLLAATLDVLARGQIISVGGSVGLLITDVELVNVTPDALESLMECLIRMLLQAALANITIPLNALVAGAVPLLTIARGPEIAADQLKLWANV